MTFEEIRQEMLAFEPIAKLVRRFIKVERVSDSVAVAMLKESGSIPGTTTLKQFQGHELRRSMYATWKRSNPTPAQRLREVVNQKASVENQLNKQAALWREAYGL